MQTDTSALSNILTQEEIDALLTPDNQETGASALQLLKAAPTQKKYPNLEKNMDAFCRYMTTALRKATEADTIAVTIQSFIVGQLGAYLDTLPTPSILGFYHVQEWKQPALISMDSGLAYCLVDMILGGRRGTSAMPLSGRTYTRIEQSLLQHFLGNLQKDFNKSFNKTFVFENLDTNPKTALIAPPACEIIITRLEISIDKRKGIMDVIFPSHLLLEIEESAEKENATANTFAENLASAVARVPLELKAVLDKKQVPFKIVADWKVGDMLPLTYFEDKPLELSCHNESLFKAALQVHKKTILVQIEKKIFEED